MDAAPGTGLDVWAACGVAMGVQLAAFFERMPGADLPRDIEHLRRQNLVVATAHAGGWTAIPEAAVDEGRWSRSIDVLLSRAVRQEAAVIEIWDLLLDGGEAIRGLSGKVQALRAQLGPTWRVQGLLLVRGTHRNRALVRQLDGLVRAALPRAVESLAQGPDRPSHADARGGRVRAGPASTAHDWSRHASEPPAPMQHSIAWTSR